MPNAGVDELRQDAAKIWTKADDIFQKADVEDRAMTEPEQAKYDAHMEEYEKILARAETKDRHERLEAGTPDTNPIASKVEFATCLQKPKCFHGPNAEKEAYAAGRWCAAAIFDHGPSIQWCKDAGVPMIQAAMSGTDNYTGGYVVAPVLEKGIIAEREERGIARRYCSVTPMASDVVQVPRTNGDCTAYPIGEIGTSTLSNPTLDMISLTAKKWGVDVIIANDLSDDSFISMADLVTQSAAWAFADAEDNVVFLGDGTGDYHNQIGIIATGAANHTNALYTALGGNTAFVTLDDADILGMLAKLHPKSWRGSVIFGSPVGISVSLWRLTRAAGGNTTADMVRAPGGVYAGMPIQPVEIMNSTVAAQVSTTGLLIMGNLNNAVRFGERRGMTMFVNPYLYSRTHQTLLQFTQRFAINCSGMGNNSSTAATRKKSHAIVLATPGS